jgi:SAM-dependent methyltransferase
MGAESDMQGFWDARAREDAFFFVDNRLDYGRPDVEQFWADGARDLEQLLEMGGARIEPDDVVVDIGCGVGRLTRAIAPHATRVYAVDVSQEMLAKATELNAELANVEWLHGNGWDLTGIPDGGASACVSHVVFQHLPDPELTLGYVRDMGRVLRPGGWAVFQVSNDPDVHRPQRGVRHRLRVLAGRAPRGQTDGRWVGSAVELEALTAAARDGGLEVERVANEGTQYCVVRLVRPPSRT